MSIGKSGSLACRQSAFALFVVVALFPYAAASQPSARSLLGDQEPDAPVDNRRAHQEGCVATLADGGW